MHVAGAEIQLFAMLVTSGLSQNQICKEQLQEWEQASNPLHL